MPSRKSSGTTCSLVIAVHSKSSKLRLVASPCAAFYAADLASGHRLQKGILASLAHVEASKHRRWKVQRDLGASTESETIVRLLM